MRGAGTRRRREGEARGRRARRRGGPRALAALTLAAAFSALPATASAAPIFTVAGSGPAHAVVGGFGGDGGLATRARLFFPTDVSPTDDGGLLVADQTNHRIRLVTASGLIRTVAGSGRQGFGGDGGRATRARLSSPTAVASLGGGAFLIADTGNNRIRLVSADGRIETVAGTGAEAHRGDGGPAEDAALRFPGDVVRDPAGGYLIADTGNNRVRRVRPDGVIEAVAGSGPARPGEGGFGGDGGPALEARLNGPSGVAPADDGSSLLIADTLNNRVRLVGADGRIATVAGSGGAGEGDFTGDGGAATRARLSGPFGVAALPGGGFAVADTNNQRIREVDARGVISTVAGSGGFGFRAGGFRGDGGGATRARLSQPFAVAAEPGGGFAIADTHNNRVRVVGRARVAVAVRGERLRARAGTRLRLRFTASRPGAVSGRVLRGRRVAMRFAARARGGDNRLTLPRRLATGRYSVEIVLRADGARASDSARLVVSAGERPQRIPQTR